MEREKKKIQSQLDITKRTQKVELQHAKKKAVENAEQMLTQKLSACKKAYEEEFEVLAKQFEELKIEVDEQRERES